MRICKGMLSGCLLAALLLTGGCAGESAEAGTAATVTEEKEEEASIDLFAMDTYMYVTAYGANANEAVNAAAEEIERLDSLLSTGDSDSEVAALNRNGGGLLSEETAYLTELSLELYENTNGAFDITVYPLTEAWGFTTGNFRVPESLEIEEILKCVGAENLFYDGKDGTLSFEKDGVQIDFGGIAKGYTSARIMEIFEKYGVKSGIVNLGGNVQTYGTKTDGSLWRVGIQSPEEDGTYLGVLSVADQAVITSGGYERYFEEDGVKYHHILNPADGYPAESGLVSVTIVSSDGALADGLSTSLFVMGLDRSIEYWRTYSELFDAVLMTEDGRLYVTEGLETGFTSDLEYEIVGKEES